MKRHKGNRHRPGKRAAERDDRVRTSRDERLSPGERMSRAFEGKSERGRAPKNVESVRPTNSESVHPSSSERRRPSSLERERPARAKTDTPRTSFNASRVSVDDARANASEMFEQGDDAHVFGVQPVLEALRAGARPVERVTIAEGAHEARLHEIFELARGAGVPIRRAPRAELQRLAAWANHQGVVATIAAARYADADRLLDTLAARIGTEEPPLAVVLDGVEDPRNLGAIIRTVECAGAHGVFVPERRAAGLTETVAKAAAGALEYVQVARAANIVRLLDELKKRNIWTIGTAADAGVAYTEWDWKQPCALLLGGEGAGLRRLVRERCDMLVSVPVLGQIESLNVSVAAGIILYEAVRQRTARRSEAYNGNRSDK